MSMFLLLKYLSFVGSSWESKGNSLFSQRVLFRDKLENFMFKINVSKIDTRFT